MGALWQVLYVSGTWSQWKVFVFHSDYKNKQVRWLQINVIFNVFVQGYLTDKTLDSLKYLMEMMICELFW